MDLRTSYHTKPPYLYIYYQDTHLVLLLLIDGLDVVAGEDMFLVLVYWALLLSNFLLSLSGVLYYLPSTFEHGLV